MKRRTFIAGLIAAPFAVLFGVVGKVSSKPREGWVNEDGTWHHVKFGRESMYLDGRLVDESEMPDGVVHDYSSASLTQSA